MAHALTLATRRFRWEACRNTRHRVNPMAGVGPMGGGGVSAVGCTVQGPSGGSTRSLGSQLAPVSIVAGGVTARRCQAWRLDRMA